MKSADPNQHSFTKSVCQSLAAEELIPEIEAVERYFGGSNYKADPKTRAIIQDAIQQVCRIVSPTLVLAIDPVQSQSAGILHLRGGQIVPLPDPVCGISARFIAAGIGTLGSGLEMACRLLAAEHNIYQSMLLDAVGTAMLDIMDTKIRARVDEHSRLLGLYSGVRFAPGLDGYPMNHQKTLFELVDGLSIDVRINAAFLMEPVKTISCFTVLHSEKTVNPSAKKCTLCRLLRCQFRQGPPSATHVVKQQE